MLPKVGQLEENTYIKMDFLIQITQMLLKAKLIMCDDDDEDLTPNLIINLFLEYKNTKLSLNKIIPIKTKLKM